MMNSLLSIRSLPALRQCCRTPWNVTFISLRCERISGSSQTSPPDTQDGRVRLSKIWLPTGGIAATAGEDAHSKLVRAGFLRQAHSGIFHMLPLGRRVQNKLEALIDKYMFQLGASKLDLSSISSEEIWARSGRLEAVGSELFRFTDRKDAKYLLSPTHEEEITALVSGTVKSYRDLPIRLYQISRKYRDELRPRHGLLRSREFTMKDLYTFDHSSSLALATYDEVRQAYSRIFNELKLPYLVAEADSGSIGGNLSHEYHFPTSNGEDHVISCSDCNYVANEELAESRLPTKIEIDSANAVSSDLSPDSAVVIKVWRGLTLDRSVLINAWYSTPCIFPGALSASDGFDVNLRAIKEFLPDFDPSVDSPLRFWEQKKKSESLPPPDRVVNLFDVRLPDAAIASIESGNTAVPVWPAALPKRDLAPSFEFHALDPNNGRSFNLLRIRNGDRCPRCAEGSLNVQTAIELGHTFHLGTRYSEPMMANVEVPWSDPAHETGFNSTTAQFKRGSKRQVPMQMGCHGIGVSRMIGAVADSLADEKGLNWPRVLAPYEVIVVPGRGSEDAALEVYDMLSVQPTAEHGCLDLVLDDRNQSFPWKMQDADLIGYPIIVVVGKRWIAERVCEVQCRRLGVRAQIPVADIFGYINTLLRQL